MIVQVTPVIDPQLQHICRREYPGHPKGCPNYGRKAGCPPGRQLFDRYYDTDKPVWAIVTEFDLGEHVERMRTAHPGWSDAQLRCCLYWQGGARKRLKSEILLFILSHAEQPYKVTSVPEAMGVNVTATLRQAGIELEWPPVRVARQVALAAIPRGEERRLVSTCLVDSVRS